MYIFCPSCHGTKVKKNGQTHYGKQNHQCKCCGRQFVLKKALIEKSLKERLSLRAICRVFGVSLNWLQSFAHYLWEQVPDDLGLSHIGGRGKKAAKKFWEKIPLILRSCYFETDDWEAYRSIIPTNQHKVGKDLTFYIEGFNATIRARVSRLVRKTLSFSKKDKWHKNAIAWFFWQFNLERQPYI